MRPRTGSRELLIVLICLVGIAVLNDYSHNSYTHITNPWPTIRRAFGMDVLSGYKRMTLYDLMNQYQTDRKGIEGLKGVAFTGQILREQVPSSDSPEGSAKDDKVGQTFKVYRRFSENGQEDGSHVISVRVHYPQPNTFGINQWIFVQGKVKVDPETASTRPEPMIEATEVTKDETPPTNPILTPHGEQPMPGVEEGHSD